MGSVVSCICGGEEPRRQPQNQRAHARAIPEQRQQIQPVSIPTEPARRQENQQVRINRSDSEEAVRQSILSIQEAEETNTARAIAESLDPWYGSLDYQFASIAWEDDNPDTWPICWIPECGFPCHPQSVQRLPAESECPYVCCARHECLDRMYCRWADVQEDQRIQAEAARAEAAQREERKRQQEACERRDPEEKMRAEVAGHNTEGDCWNIINGKVYNLTQYVSSGQHPGGKAILLEWAGKDVSEEFNLYHPPNALNELSEDAFIKDVPTNHRS